MGFPKWKIIFIVLAIIAVLAAVGFYVFLNEINTKNEPTDYTNLASINNAQNIPEVVNSDPKGVKLVNPPEIIRAVYVTGYSAKSKKYLSYLSDLFKNTEINSVVVDIKGSSGYLSFYDESKMDELVNFLHGKNIYVIGRIAVFEDPVYAKAKPELAIYDSKSTTDKSQPVLWKDNNGLSWLDPASKDVWDYNIGLARNAFSHGFDEINFDYVRFPSDGKTENMGFPVWDLKKYKSEVIKNFFQYVRQELTGEKISVDLFGQTTNNKDDMGIGQIIENAFENFDYVSPMIYPSHYADNYLGFANPAEHPYEIVKYSMLNALLREKIFMKNNPDKTQLAKFRPWLQDFNMGAYYTAEMVGKEIKATQEALGDEYNGFMLWNPSNIYTQGAVLKTE